jgi:choline dehydrogenase-like flavoprotein
MDSFGRLIPQVNYKVPKRFYADIRKMQRQIKESLFNQAVFKNYNISDISFTSGAHYSGTCRLGFNPKSSVVDKNLKYHQINNLYICDSSVLPFIGNSNLFFTISLFSIRLAKHLYKKYISS